MEFRSCLRSEYVGNETVFEYSISANYIRSFFKVASDVFYSCSIPIFLLKLEFISLLND